jgi:hypothetical protein
LDIGQERKNSFGGASVGVRVVLHIELDPEPALSCRAAFVGSNLKW